MPEPSDTQFSHFKPGDTDDVSGGLRDFSDTATWAWPPQPRARRSRI